MNVEIGRFAPSSTGPAHPGTLLAALLCWLDARSRGGRVVLRIEDLDPQRSTRERAAALRDDLHWFGLDWDAERLQSEAGERHAAALDRLEADGRLYPCGCSRAEIRSHGRRGPDGGFAYPNTCRGRPLPPGGWRETAEPLRAQLPAGRLELRDESGLDLGMDAAAELGDPIVRRRDGGVAYQLAAVVDDAAEGVTRVVRGRDLASSTVTQVRLGELLGLRRPTFRHHLLLLEPRPGADPGRGAGGERKLAKLHGSVGAPELRAKLGADELCGWLAWVAGLVAEPEARAPRTLVADFAWARVREGDQLVEWDGRALSTSSIEASPGTPTRSGKP